MLTDEQENRINAYISARNVPWYDVRLELADHLGEQVLASMSRNGLPFEEALRQQGAIFQRDWPVILRAKAKFLRRKFLRTAGKEAVGFFSWPGILFTLTLAALVISIDRYQLLNIRYFPVLTINLIILTDVYYSRRVRKATSLKLKELSREVMGLDRAGRRAVANNVKGKMIFFSLLVGRQLFRADLYFTTIKCLYVSLVILYAIKSYDPAFCRIFLYVFPFVLISRMAWLKTYAGVRNNIQQTYPEFF